MSAFFAGVIFGAILIGSVFVAYITNFRPQRRRRRDPADWNVEFFEPEKPPVQTTVTIKKREYTL